VRAPLEINEQPPASGLLRLAASELVCVVVVVVVSAPPSLAGEAAPQTRPTRPPAIQPASPPACSPIELDRRQSFFTPNAPPKTSAAQARRPASLAYIISWAGAPPKDCGLRKRLPSAGAMSYLLIVRSHSIRYVKLVAGRSAHTARPLSHTRTHTMAITITRAIHQRRAGRQASQPIDMASRPMRARRQFSCVCHCAVAPVGSLWSGRIDRAPILRGLVSPAASRAVCGGSERALDNNDSKWRLRGPRRLLLSLS
jgi:hypothetical protein